MSDFEQILFKCPQYPSLNVAGKFRFVNGEFLATTQEQVDLINKCNVEIFADGKAPEQEDENIATKSCEMGAAEAIAVLKNLEEEYIDDFVEGEERVTVLRAAGYEPEE
jgi:hypothetical protein